MPLDQPDLLGQRNELDRRHAAEGFGGPAHQQLGAHGAARDVDLGLGHEAEAVAVGVHPQQADHAHAALGVVVERGVEKHQAVAATLLAGVHR
jgi:hypothetical protein